MKLLFWVAVIVVVVLVLRHLENTSGKRKPPPSGPARRKPPTSRRKPSPRLRSGGVRRPTSPRIRKCSPAELFEREHVSYTRLKTFHQCPRKFELVYLCGFEDKVGKAAEVGSTVHKLLEIYTADQKARYGEAKETGVVVAEILSHYDRAVAAVQPRARITRAELVPYAQNLLASTLIPCGFRRRSTTATPLMDRES